MWYPYSLLKRINACNLVIFAWWGFPACLYIWYHYSMRRWDWMACVPMLFTYSADYPEKYVYSSCHWNLVLIQWSCRVLLATKDSFPAHAAWSQKRNLNSWVRSKILHNKSPMPAAYHMMDCRQCIALYTNWPFQSAAQLLEPTSSVPMIVHHVFFPVVLSLTIEAVECF